MSTGTLPVPRLRQNGGIARAVTTSNSRANISPRFGLDNCITEGVTTWNLSHCSSSSRCCEGYNEVASDEVREIAGDLAGKWRWRAKKHLKCSLKWGPVRHIHLEVQVNYHSFQRTRPPFAAPTALEFVQKARTDIASSTNSQSSTSAPSTMSQQYSIPASAPAAIGGNNLVSNRCLWFPFVHTAPPQHRMHQLFRIPRLPVLAKARSRTQQ